MVYYIHQMRGEYKGMFLYEEEIAEVWEEEKEYYQSNWGELDEELLTYQFKLDLSSNGHTAFTKYYKLTIDGPVRVKETKRNKNSDIPELDMPCAQSTESYPGLYFIGMIGKPPLGKPYYLVKIGQAENIKKRIQQYLSYNPMVYHDNISIIVEWPHRDAAEEAAQEWLKQFAYARAMNTSEMFYVNEDDYYYICEFLKNKSNFEEIAGMA